MNPRGNKPKEGELDTLIPLSVAMGLHALTSSTRTLTCSTRCFTIGSFPTTLGIRWGLLALSPRSSLVEKASFPAVPSFLLPPLHDDCLPPQGQTKLGSRIYHFGLIVIQ